MKITLILYGHLRHYRGNREETVLLSHNESMGQILEKLSIPPDDVMAFFISGKKYDMDYIPKDGERVEVYPAISGG